MPSISLRKNDYKKRGSLPLDTTIARIGDNELFFQKTYFLRALRKKDLLRYLSVEIKQITQRYK